MRTSRGIRAETYGYGPKPKVGLDCFMEKL